MSQVLRTQLTVRPEVCFLWNYSITVFGGNDPHGCSCHLQVGPSNPIVLWRPTPRKLRRLVLSQQWKFSSSLSLSLDTKLMFNYSVIPHGFRFFNNCRLSNHRGCELSLSPSLSILELTTAEHYCILLSQRDHFATEVSLLKAKKPLPSSSCLCPLHPFLDSNDILRVGGRESNSNLSYCCCHPMILHGKHPICKLIIRSEHLRLFHAGPTLLLASLRRRFHVVYLRKTVRSITHHCMTCRHQTVRPQP